MKLRTNSTRHQPHQPVINPYRLSTEHTGVTVNGTCRRNASSGRTASELKAKLQSKISIWHTIIIIIIIIIMGAQSVVP